MGPAFCGKQHHISTWPVRLGWAGPGCQRTEPPFPGPRRQSHPGPSTTLPMTTNSCLDQTLPGPLVGRWEHQEGASQGRVDFRGHMPDPVAGPGVQGFLPTYHLNYSHPSTSRVDSRVAQPKLGTSIQCGPWRKVPSSFPLYQREIQTRVPCCSGSGGGVGLAPDY